jgi:hypothetical protein
MSLGPIGNVGKGDRRIFLRLLLSCDIGKCVCPVFLSIFPLIGLCRADVQSTPCFTSLAATRVSPLHAWGRALQDHTME